MYIIPRVNPGVLGDPGKRFLMMGNEAIARGAIEAGVSVATGYPGTPSSEVLENLVHLSAGLGIYAEWAVNEKVALDIAIGASWAGARSLATMKAPGLLVAADPLVSAAYSGVNGGLVVLVADDPGPHTTQTEQDSRWFARLAHLPLVSASSIQLAKDNVVIAYELSEYTRLPVIFRTTTRINHSMGIVVLGEPLHPRRGPGFRREPERYVRASMPWNRARHEWLLRSLGKALEKGFPDKLSSMEGEGEVLVVATGAPYMYLEELLRRGLRARVLRLDLLNPLPRGLLIDVLSEADKVLVVEENDPYLEDQLRILAGEEGLDIEIHGKDLLPEVGEIWPHHISKALSRLGAEAPELLEPSPPSGLPRRPPPLCPGCPHRASFHAIRVALNREGYRWGSVPIIGDIGCYALGLNPPLEAVWTEHSMGSSIGQAMGLKLAGWKGPVIAVIGDSTMFHTGLPALVEAAHKDVDIIVAVMDNGTVAMTGHQPTPEYAYSPSGRRLRRIELIGVLESIAPGRVFTANPFRLDEAVEVFRRALRRGPGLRIVIYRAPCAILAARRGEAGPALRVDPDRCTGCMACINLTGCLALRRSGGKVEIDENLCTGCGLCSYVCPYGAIVGGGGK